MEYNHTQTGYMMLVAIFAIILITGYAMSQTGIEIIAIIILTFVILVVSSFSKLNVIVDKEYIKIKFGWGIFKTQFPLENIASAKAVRNAWYHGWGIRYWFWPRMTIYNVSGFDAVEITTKDGKIYRIGTDEPMKLESAIKQSIK